LSTIKNIRQRGLRHGRSVITLFAGALLIFISAFEESRSAEATQSTASLESHGDLYNSLPDEIKRKGKIVVGSNAPYAPYDMFVSEGSSELGGMEIDLGKEIAKRIGIDIEFTQQPFDGLITGLQAHSYDAIMAGMAVTPVRQEQVLFVPWAYEARTAMLMKKSRNDIVDASSLCGKTVAVQSGANAVNHLMKETKVCEAEGRGTIDIKAYPQYSDALMAVKTGTADTFIETSTAHAAAAMQDDTLKVVQAANGGIGYRSGEEPLMQLGIGFRKDETRLAEIFDKAINALIDDGTYRTIFDKYRAYQLDNTMLRRGGK